MKEETCIQRCLMFKLVKNFLVFKAQDEEEDDDDGDIVSYPKINKLL